MLSRRHFLVTASSAAVAQAASGPTVTAAPQTGQPRPRLLSGALTAEKLGVLLRPRAEWKPFPDAGERAVWAQLPQDTREVAVAAGERRLKTGWPALPATLFLEYRRIGNRSNYERVWGERREHLREAVIAECVEGKGRFLDDIGNGIWTICEETFWGFPAHIGVQKAGSGLPDASEQVVDLFAGETSSLLAWTEYLLGERLDTVSPRIRERIAFEIRRRILAPCLEREDFGWMGLGPNTRRTVNNWNPWINSNWLTAVLLVENDPVRRGAAAHKILRSLDRFLDGYHDDGGCDEGPGYWGRAGASLFDCLELLHEASGGQIDFYRLPLVGEIGRYIYRAHISGDWYTNFGDASARTRIPGDLVFRYGRRIGDEKMQLLGAWAAAQEGTGRASRESLGRQLPALFNLAELRTAPKRQPLARDVWLPGIEVMAARRREGSPEGLYLAAQGGHNAQSHNHNDVGNFLVFADGKPAIIDVGVETYSAKTFSSRRYEIWTMQSAWHNLPTIDGIQQAAGRRFAARDVSYRADDGAAELSMDIAPAYADDAGVRQWKRRFRLDRTRNQVDLRDEYELSRPASIITLTLMTPCQVRPAGEGVLELSGAARVDVRFDAKSLRATVEEVKIEDGRLRQSWGERLYRILLTAENPPPAGEWTVRISQGA